MVEWDKQFPLQNRESLREHCKSIIVPVVEYYEKLFQDEVGDNYRVRCATNACKLFNPFISKSSEIIFLWSITITLLYEPDFYSVHLKNLSNN